MVGREGHAHPSGGVRGHRYELQRAGAPDAWHLFDLWTHATPPAIARIEGYRAEDWETSGHEGVVPRTSLNPLLHFSGDPSDRQTC